MGDSEQNQENIDLSRTEAVLDALVAAIEARAKVEAVKARYSKFDAATMGEMPLEHALIAPTEVYLHKLDVLRATLTSVGVQV